METLKDIERARKRRDKAYEYANRQLVAGIQAARERGETWPAIAQAMGMTRMGLHKFMARAETEDGGES